MKKLCLIVISVFFLACEKKELPVPKYDRGDLVSAQIKLQPDYRDQVWFSLSENKVVATNFKTGWDIAFSGAAEGFHIILNGSNSARAFKTNVSDFSAVNDTLGLAAGERSDSPGGHLDSTAFGNPLEGNRVYVINRGYSETGEHLGYFKLKVTEISADAYTIVYGKIGSQEIKTATIVKDPAFNFKAFSFATGATVAIEPPKTNYDLCFTQYTHIFYDPFQYYQVSGVLLNPYNTRVLKFKEADFSSLSLSDTLKGVFSSRTDAIGYDWKSFNLNANIYTVNSKNCYIIQDNKGFFYKLHFIDFYDSKGMKGAPKFEYKRL